VENWACRALANPAYLTRPLAEGETRSSEARPGEMRHLRISTTMDIRTQFVAESQLRVVQNSVRLACDEADAIRCQPKNEKRSKSLKMMVAQERSGTPDVGLFRTPLFNTSNALGTAEDCLGTS